MPTVAFSSAGTKIYVSAGVPATYNAAGFGALTYTEIKECTDLGAVGPESAVITHNPIGEAGTYKLRGTRNNGQLQLKGGRASGVEPGQDLLIAAEKSNNPYAFKIVLQNGSIIYLQGLVVSFRTNIGNQGQITMFESNVEVSGDIVQG